MPPGTEPPPTAKVHPLLGIGRQKAVHVLDRAVGGHHDRPRSPRWSRPRAVRSRKLCGKTPVSERITMGVEFTISVLSRLSAFSIMWGDRDTAAAAGHVLEGRAADKAGFGQRLTGSACRAVPTATGAAGNDEVELFEHLVVVGLSRAPEGQRGRSRRQHDPTGHGHFHLIFPPSAHGRVPPALSKICGGAGWHIPTRGGNHVCRRIRNCVTEAAAAR